MEPEKELKLDPIFDPALTKLRIQDCVDSYKVAFAQEYQIVKEAIKRNLSMHSDPFNPTGSIKKAKVAHGDLLQRIALEVPERLDNTLRKFLSEYEYAWFYGQTKEQATEEERNAPMRWFGLAYPEFRRVEKI